MSISAMKQALEALELALNSHNVLLTTNPIQDAWQARQVEPQARQAITALRKAIAEAEKQEPVAFVSGYTNGECVVMPMNPAVVFSVGTALYNAPVHASDISQERVDETAKREHEWVGLDGDIPGLGLVTEEFYNGMLCAEDILRKRNT